MADFSIPQVQVPNMAALYQEGQQVGRQNALTAAMQQYGSAAVMGDQNALAAIAQFDPQAALGLMSGRQQMDLRERADSRDAASHEIGIAQGSQAMEIARQRAREATEAHKANMTGQQRELAMQEIQLIGAFGNVGSEQEWDALADRLQIPDLKGQFDQRDALVGMAMGITDALAEPPSPTDDMREFDRAQQDPAFAEYMAGRRPQTNVNVASSPGETEYDKARGKGFAERANAIDTEASAARSAITALDAMEGAMQTPGFYSGQGGETVLALKRTAAALGMDPDGVASMEQFNAMSKQAALASMGGSLGTGFSNADRDFVIQQVPNLGNTPEGNGQLIGIQRKIQQRKLEIAELARDYEDRVGRIDRGFEEEVARFAEENPLFPPSPPSGSVGAGATGSGVQWRLID
jgi:hypothetical protein